MVARNRQGSKENLGAGNRPVILAGGLRCEGASPSALTRKGFQKGLAKLGDKMVVDGYAAKDGSHLMNARRIYLNGKLIFDGVNDGAGQ
jgi:hypothetical protein